MSTASRLVSVDLSRNSEVGEEALELLRASRPKLKVVVDARAEHGSASGGLGEVE